MLAAHMRQRTGRPVRVVNLSVSGARLREALQLQLPKLRKLHPDVLTVSIGANDIAGFDAERFERELRELYSALPRHAIVADLPAFYFGAAEKNVRIANGIVHRVADELGLDGRPAVRGDQAPVRAAVRAEPGRGRLLPPERSRIPGVGIRLHSPPRQARSGRAIHRSGSD